MKSVISTILIAIFITIGVTDIKAQSSDNFSLEDYKWKNRILLVFSPNTYNSDYRDQMKSLQSFKGGVQERDLEVFYALDQSSPTTKGQVLSDDATVNLQNRFDVSSADFAVILIGKDGTEKLRTQEALSMEKLFDTIDAMPMRKLEIKNNGN